MTLNVVIEKAQGNWCAYTPDDIGSVIAVGDSREAVVDDFRSALRTHLEAMRKSGLEIPEIDGLSIQELVPV